MFAIPKPRVSRDQLKKFVTDPELVTLELLFIFMTLANILVMYRLFAAAIPFPITVTWFQLTVGFILAVVMGEAGKTFPKCAYFPRFNLSSSKAIELAVPTIVYLAMISVQNVLLAHAPSVATFPVMLSFAVTLHHVGRHFGCGQSYLPVRWAAIGVMGIGFLLSALDSKTMGLKLLPLALSYAIFSAVFRAWCLEKAMHTVEGKGNELHNHQVVVGIVVLPLIAVLFREHRFLQWMPYNATKLYTWQMWGCLATSGFLPFIKNIIANRLVKKTGQAPWRALEITSVLFLFIFGGFLWGGVSVVGFVATALVISGRAVGMLDVLSRPTNSETAAHGSRPKVRAEATHNAPPPAESAVELGLEGGEDQEMEATPAPLIEEEPNHSAPMLREKSGVSYELLNA